MLLSCCPWQRVWPPLLPSQHHLALALPFTSVLHPGLLGPFPAALLSPCFLRPHSFFPRATSRVQLLHGVQVGVSDGCPPFHCNIYSWAVFLTFIPQCMAAELFCFFLFVAKGFHAIKFLILFSGKVCSVGSLYQTLEAASYDLLM